MCTLFRLFRSSHRADIFGPVLIISGIIFIRFPEKEFSSLIKSGDLFWRPPLCQTVRSLEFLNKKVFRYLWNCLRTGRTDIRHLDPVLDHFGAVTVAIYVNFGFEPKLQLYLCRPCSGTGPDGSLRCVARSARFKKFRIISTPLVRPGVRAGARKLQKTCGAQKYENFL